LALSTIPTIKRAQIGRRIRVDAGYDRSFGDKTYEYSTIIEFADRTALVQYLNHPLHQQLGRLFWENCESTVISEVELVEASDDEGLTDLVRRPQD